MTTRPNLSVLIVAAGAGQRAGGEIPKQFRTLAGRSVLARSVEAMRKALPEASIRVIINQTHRSLYDNATAGLGLPEPIAGGATRAESVRNALRALRPENPEIVLIHDAARPFAAPDTVARLVAAVCGETIGAVPGLPVSDSIKRTNPNSFVQEDLDRHALWTVQTPQVFRYADIADAFDTHFRADATDDVAIARAAGLTVRMVAADPDNVKLTYEADFAKAERRLAASLQDIRSGSGFDVHAFGTGDHLMLCGVRVPFDHALEGHSDADVGLHALTDAILGAICAGDIGMHFSPADPRWRGASSDRFLDHARSLVAERGGVVAHCDVTLICEAPKIGPHRDAMTKRVAEILLIGTDRVSIKATTTEKLGFTGRREGIAAMATATVRLP